MRDPQPGEVWDLEGTVVLVLSPRQLDPRRGDDRVMCCTLENFDPDTSFASGGTIDWSVIWFGPRSSLPARRIA